MGEVLERGSVFGVAEGAGREGIMSGWVGRDRLGWGLGGLGGGREGEWWAGAEQTTLFLGRAEPLHAANSRPYERLPENCFYRVILDAGGVGQGGDHQTWEAPSRGKLCLVLSSTTS